MLLRYFLAFLYIVQCMVFFSVTGRVLSPADRQSCGERRPPGSVGGPVAPGPIGGGEGGDEPAAGVIPSSSEVVRVIGDAVGGLVQEEEERRSIP